MDNKNIKFRIILIISLIYIKIAHGNENCDCDILQIYDPKDPTKSHNFMKEIDDESEQIVFSSKEQYYFQWSDEEDSWIWNLFTQSEKTFNNSVCLAVRQAELEFRRVQVRNSYAVQHGKWKVLLNGKSNFVNSRCLALKSKEDKCDISNQTYELNLSNSSFTYFTSCVFPFKYKDNE